MALSLYSILSIYNTLYPGVLIYGKQGKQYICIIAKVSIDLNNPTKENPEIKISKNFIRWNNGRSNIEITLGFYNNDRFNIENTWDFY